MYYQIDEALAKQAQEMRSFYDYVAGSATASYRAAVDEAAAIAEKQKERTSAYYHGKIDALFDRYAERLADWINASNRNAASCPSVMVAGPSNFPVRKKEKQNARAESLHAEYKDISAILDKIRSTGTGPVDLADPDAREILQDQLSKAQQLSDDAKKINAYYRKYHTVIGCPVLSADAAEKMQSELDEIMQRAPFHDAPYSSYELSSIRSRIKRIQDRLDQLDKLQSVPEGEHEKEYTGFRIVRNAELNRLQIIFDGKPGENARALLKSNGFRWAPSSGAWQRQLTDNAERAAQKCIDAIKDAWQD